ETASIPSAAGVANDAEKPGAPVAAGKGAEVAERTHRCFLQHVFGIVLVVYQPACQAARGLEVRQHDIVEALGSPRCAYRSIRLVIHGRTPTVCLTPCSRVG